MADEGKSFASFGNAIAFLIPGFVVVWQLSAISPVLANWLGLETSSALLGGQQFSKPAGTALPSPTTSPSAPAPASTAAPSVGGFAYAAIASLVLGLIVSAIRAQLLDRLHHKTGVQLPNLNYKNLQANREAFTIVIENLYRYYQFYGNLFVAVGGAYVIHLWNTGMTIRWWGLLGIVALEVVLFVSSRDSLERTYSRLQHVLN